MLRSRMWSTGIACLLILSGALVRGGSPMLAAGSLTVTTTADDSSACTAAHCSLRAALLKADADGTGDTIKFNIPARDAGCSGSPAVCIIQPASLLPALTASKTTIDGYSQPGAMPNSDSATGRHGGDTAVVLIQVDGTFTPAPNGSADALDIQGAHNLIRGLSLTGFFRAIGLDGAGAIGNLIQGNFIGIAPDGLHASAGTYFGIEATENSGTHDGGNTIGGPNPAAANLIEGAGYAVDLKAHDGTLIQGNFIGTESGGTMPGTDFNNLADGILLSSADRTHVMGNLVAGYGDAQIESDSSSHVTVAGNLIGTSVYGDSTIGGSVVSMRVIQGTGNTIGGPTSAAGNVIDGGVLVVENNDGFMVAHNLIGTDATGIRAIGAGGEGILLGSDNTAGNNLPGKVLDNVISEGAGRSSSEFGAVEMEGDIGTAIQGNVIGTDIGGDGALGNPDDGIFVTSVNFNTGIAPSQGLVIGGAGKGQGNIISGNGGSGISLQGVNGIRILGNRIGTDAAGKVALRNVGQGITVGDYTNGNTTQNSSTVTIGGADAGAGNLISANKFGGISLNNVQGSTIQGNLIGTDSTASRALGNGHTLFGSAGIAVYSGAHATIGGSRKGAGNVIAAGGGDGVTVSNVGDVVNVQGNFIGTDPSGRLHLGNRAAGISATGSVQIGATDAGAANVIAFNGWAGVAVGDDCPNCTQPTYNHVGITQNAIYGNSHLGINLSPTFGKPLDGTDGYINCVNAPTTNSGILCPVIGSATTSSISGHAGHQQRIEVFLSTHDRRDSGHDSSGTPAYFGQGKTFLGATTSSQFTFNGKFAWFFSVPKSIKLKPGQWITATATNGNGDTSEFAEDVQVH